MVLSASHPPPAVGLLSARVFSFVFFYRHPRYSEGRCVVHVSLVCRFTSLCASQRVRGSSVSVRMYVWSAFRTRGEGTTAYDVLRHIMVDDIMSSM